MTKRRLLKNLAIGCGAVVLALVVVLAGVSTWLALTGRAEWKAVQKSLIEKNEPMLLTELAPEPVPNEDNFFADPIWTELIAKRENDTSDPVQMDALKLPLAAEDRARFEQEFPTLAPLPDKDSVRSLVLQLRTDRGLGPDDPLPQDVAVFVLSSTAPATGVIETMRSLAERQSARYPVTYEKGFTAGIDHVSPLLSAAQTLKLRAEAQLALGDPQAAFADLKLLLYLASTLSSEPLLISLLVEISTQMIGLSVVKIGMEDWNDEELAEIARWLSQIDLADRLVHTLRGERAGFNTLVEGKFDIGALFATYPDASGGTSFWTAVAVQGYSWVLLDGDQAFYNQSLQEFIEALTADVPRIMPATTKRFDDQWQAIKASPSQNVRRLLSLLAMPAITGVPKRVAKAQAEVALASAAVAIEQFFRANGELPGSLSDLVPEFLPSVPMDPIDGAPIRSRVEGVGSFLLYSIGWNDVDDGGRSPESPRKIEENDWIWRGQVLAR